LTGAATPPSLAPGERFGRYEIRAEIGRGALGRVYHAFDPLTSRPVALKLMRTACLSAHTLDLYRRRFQMEAQAAGRLAHPNIVRIFDQGEDHLVMEFLDGMLLSRRLRGRRFGLDEALAILAGLAGALDYAHAHGVVHRDVRPRNIMLLPDGTPKLTDFGLALFPGGDDSVGGNFLGHPAYLAPEHIVEGRATPLSDVFSLGAVAYEMLTGQRAFPGQNAGTVIHRVVYDEPVPPTRVNSRLPSAYDAILRRVLDKEPGRRPPTASAFLHALTQHRDAARRLAPRRTAARKGRDPRAQDTLDLGRPSRRPRAPEPAPPAPAPSPAPITLTVASDPVGAMVWLDGIPVGESPAMLGQVARGGHTLRVIARGFVPVQMGLDVTGSATLLVTLQPATLSRERPEEDGFTAGFARRASQIGRAHV